MTAAGGGCPGPAPLLVASDLDGTLVRSDGSISPRTRAAIAAVEAAGAVFVMVTGRPSRWMRQVSQETGHAGLAVCANGAVLYDLHSERVLQSELLPARTALEVVAALRRALPGIAFAVERPETGFAHEPGYLPRWDAAPGLTVAPVEDLLGSGVVKLLARHEQLSSDALLAAGHTAVGAAATLTHSSLDGLLEVSAAGVSKASGLARLAREHGIGPDRTVAFGDMPNDLPMLGWAGCGVAMANAHQEVLAIADEVTATNDEDGVARVLERWFPVPG